MAEGFRFMPLGLVRRRTFRQVHGLLRCNINTIIHAHARRAEVSLRDVTIAQMGNGGQQVRMMSLTWSARRILGDFEKVCELRWDLPRGKTVGFSLLAETLWQVSHVCVGGQMKKTE